MTVSIPSSPRQDGLPEALGAWGGRRILIVGDVMLDRFVYGDVGRISPEAPVPVMRHRRERMMLGGAGNVARNVAAMGGRAHLIGLCGADAAGDMIIKLADGEGIGCDLVTADAPTTQKTRFVAQGQQLLRLDDESAAPHPDAGPAIVAAAIAAMDCSDAVVLSDYAKGVLSDAVLPELIAAARLRGLPIAVDPKRADFNAYAGVTLLTPNAAETRLATGIDPADDLQAEIAGRRLLKAAASQAVLITRGANGMTLVTETGSRHLTSNAREVFDVSGAGDTLMAAMALSLAAGCELAQGALIANVAAGIVVGRAGTATTDREAIARELTVSGDPGGDSLIASRAEAAAAADRWKAEGKIVGFTNGCFDLLHAGHVSLLMQARAACDRLIVGLNADASVRRLKGPTRPLQTDRDRARILAAMRAVDLVVTFEDETPLSLIEAIEPDVLVKGADYAGRDIAGRELVERSGGRVVLVDLVPGRSTTNIATQFTLTETQS